MKFFCLPVFLNRGYEKSAKEEKAGITTSYTIRTGFS